MRLKVTERCLTYDDNEEPVYANRHFLYESDDNIERDFDESVVDMLINFDTDCILDNYDEFPYECQSSETIKIEETNLTYLTEDNIK